MATAKQGTVTKIYDLRTLGYDQIHQQLQQITKDFDAIRKAKLDAAKNLAGTADVEATAQYITELQKLQLKEQEIRVQREQLITQAKTIQIQRQQETQQLKDQAKGAQAAAGSYQQIYNEYKQLYALVKSTPKGQIVNFQGASLQFDQAILKLKELATAEQDFRRQFARDGLLVAEYSSGIIQAFEKADLGTLISGQIGKAEGHLTQLNAEFEQLRNEFNQAKATGVGDLGAIEQKLVENRKEAISLTSQITVFKENLRGTGSIGDTVTKAIGNGFKSIKEQATGFVLTFVGIQAALSKIEQFGEKASEEFQKFETSTARLKGALHNLGRENELEGLTKNVEELSKRFRFLDENDIRAATTSLVLFNKLGTEQIKKLLPVIVDFSTQQGQSIEEATKLFLKAIEGGRGAQVFKQFGIQLKDASSEEGRFALLTDDLGKKLQGIGDTFDKSTSGAIARNKEEWKKLAEQIGQKVIPTLTAIGGVVVNVASAIFSIPFPVLIAGLTALTAALALYKAEQIRTYVVTQLATKQGLIYNAYLIAQRIYTLAAAAATKLATAEIVLFNGAIRISPIGIFLTLLGLIIPAVALYASKLREAKTEQSALQQVNKEASKTYNEQIGKINGLITVVKSAATSIDTKKKAVEQLTAIDKEFSKVIKDNTIDLGELDRAYIQVAKSIELAARAQAAAKFTAQAQEQVNTIAEIRQLIETAQATGGGPIDISTLTAEQQKIVGSQTQIGAFKGLFQSGKAQTDKFIAALKAEEDRRILSLQKFAFIQQKTEADLQKFLESQQVEAATFEVDIKGLRDKITKLDGEIQDFQGSKADLDKKVAERKKLQEELKKLIPDEKTTTPEKPRAAKLSVDIQDQIKDIDAVRATMLAEEELKRKQNLESEEKYLQNVLLINEVAIDQKLALLKGSNEEERKVRAELQLEKINKEQETNDKIFDLRQKALKAQLDQDIANIELERDTRIADPTLTETERQRIKLEADQKILQLQLNFNQAIGDLEKQLGQQTLANTKESAEAVKKVKLQILADQRGLDEAALTDAQTAAAKNIQEFKQTLATLKLAILQDSDLTPAKRNQLLGLAQGQENIGILAREVDAAQKQLPIYKQLLADKVITDQQYQQFVTDLTNKQIELQNALLAGLNENIDKIKALYKGLLDAGKITAAEYDKLIADLNNTAAKGVNQAAKTAKSLKDLLVSGVDKLFNINTDTAKGKALSEGIAVALTETYALATTAMNNYFNAEEERIKANLELQNERLDMEKEQVESRAQSQAEIDSIEKQYALKKKQAQKQAGEQLKKVKISEAKIALATELINIGVQASQLPFPASLIVGAILTAAALASYAVQIGNIQKQVFKLGGQPGITRHNFTEYRTYKTVKNIFGMGGQPGQAISGTQGMQRFRESLTKAVTKVTNTVTKVTKLTDRQGKSEHFSDHTTELKAIPGAATTETTKNTFVTTKTTREEKVPFLVPGTDHGTSEKTVIEQTTSEPGIIKGFIGKMPGTLPEQTTPKPEFAQGGTPKVDSNQDQEEIRKKKKKKFSFGGQAGEVPVTGGTFGGKPHSQGGTDFTFKGHVYNAEVDELAIIRTRNAPRNKRFQIIGTQMEIASMINRLGGGTHFKPGAKLKQLATGGILGTALQPPVFNTPLSAANNDAMIAELKKITAKLDETKASNLALAKETSERIDRQQVVVTERDITQAQKKNIKRSTIGTLS